MLRIVLKKSPVGYDKRQGRTVKALGLGKLNSSVVRPDNEQIRGMIRKIAHLVEVKPGDEAAPGGE